MARSRPIRPPGYSGTPLHAPLLSTGKIPFWGGAGATLNLQYGTQYLTAYVSYYFRVNREEYQGYANPQLGPGVRPAYLLITPDPIGTLRLQFRVGAFTEVYAGPGQWGWGIFGPMLGAARLRRDDQRRVGPDARRAPDASRTGCSSSPACPRTSPRGDYNSWIETGVSSYVHHAHVGLVLDNQYIFKLHYAADHGTDERTYLQTFLGTPPQDGRMDTYLGEARWQGVPWGQVGVSGGRLRLPARRRRSATASGGPSTGRRAPAR